MTDTTTDVLGDMAITPALNDYFEATEAAAGADEAREAARAAAEEAHKNASRLEQERLDKAKAVGERLAAVLGDDFHTLKAMLEGFLGSADVAGAKARAQAVFAVAAKAQEGDYGAEIFNFVDPPEAD